MIPNEMQITAGIYTFIKHHMRNDKGEVVYAVPGGGRATADSIYDWAKKNKLKPRMEPKK